MSGAQLFDGINFVFIALTLALGAFWIADVILTIGERRDSR